MLETPLGLKRHPSFAVSFSLKMSYMGEAIAPPCIVRYRMATASWGTRRARGFRAPTRLLIPRFVSG